MEAESIESNENGDASVLNPQPTLVSDLKDHPRNYRTHPEDQLAHIVASIREHGFYRNVVIANDGTILAGHGVVQACRIIGLETIPTIRLDIGPDDPAALKVMTGDNLISQLAEVDDRDLTELLKELSDADQLMGTGFDAQMLSALVMVTRPASEIADQKEADQWIGMPEHTNGPQRISMTVQFRTEEDRVKFLTEVLCLEKTKVVMGIPTIWWPERERNDVASLEFGESEEK